MHPHPMRRGRKLDRSVRAVEAERGNEESRLRAGLVLRSRSPAHRGNRTSLTKQTCGAGARLSLQEVRHVHGKW
jgi:hypothetical protein